MIFRFKMKATFIAYSIYLILISIIAISPLDAKAKSKKRSKKTPVTYQGAKQAFSKSRFFLARTQLEKIVKKNPKNYEAQTLLGACYYYTENPKMRLTS